MGGSAQSWTSMLLFMLASPPTSFPAFRILSQTVDCTFASLCAFSMQFMGDSGVILYVWLTRITIVVDSVDGKSACFISLVDHDSISLPLLLE